MSSDVTAEPSDGPAPEGAVVTAVLPEAVDGPGEGVVGAGADAGERRRRRSRFLLANVLPAVLVLGAVGGAAAYIGTAVDGADTTSPTIAWRKPVTHGHNPDPARSVARGRTDSPLARDLLPVPEGGTLGPDVLGLGNDEVLSRTRAVAYLSAERGRPFGTESTIDGSDADKQYKSLAVRSYIPYHGIVMAEVHLLQGRSAADARRGYENASLGAEFSSHGDPVDVPKWRNATCYAQEKKDKSETNRVFCEAYVGDLLVELSSYGPDAKVKDAVSMMRDQLDHIEASGKAV